MTKKKNPEDLLKRGAHLKFSTPQELQKKVKEYFTKGCKKKTLVIGGVKVKIPTPTITGLSLYLGFCSRQSFYDYENYPEFSYTIKKARSLIEDTYEVQLHNPNCTGAIFALKNFGWIDHPNVNLDQSKHYYTVTLESLVKSVYSTTNTNREGTGSSQLPVNRVAQVSDS